MPSRRGFTLIEVLIVSAITTLLASVILTYTNRGREQIALQVERSKLAQVILKAKSLSISTFNNPDVPCGYGVIMDYDANTYSLFSYSPNSCARMESIDTQGSDFKILETFNLDKNLDFGLEQDSTEIIFFIPPDPKAVIWRHGNIQFPIGENDTEDWGKIHLKTKSGSRETAIKINLAGQITY